MELKGIDVSKWNGTIDWKKVAATGVQFAMVRAGTGKSKGGATVDPRFLDNVCGAYENGIRVGVYLYSYAMSAEAAMKEAAEHVRKGAIAKIAAAVQAKREQVKKEAAAKAASTQPAGNGAAPTLTMAGIHSAGQTGKAA